MYIWRSQGFSHCILRENHHWRAKKDLKQEEAVANNREVKCLVICLACCMLQVLISNCVSKPRTTPLSFSTLKRSHCLRVMLLILAEICSWAHTELQELETEGYGPHNRKPTFPSLHCPLDRHIQGSYLLVFILWTSHSLSIVTWPSNHINTTKISWCFTDAFPGQNNSLTQKEKNRKPVWFPLSTLF